MTITTTQDRTDESRAVAAAIDLERPLASGRMPAVHPFSLRQAVDLLRTTPGYHGDVVIEDGAVHAALAVDHRRYGLRVVEDPIGVRYEVYGEHPPGSGDLEEIRIALDRWLSLSDDVAGFHECAAGDHPKFAAIAEQYSGLHHVRHLSLAEAVVTFVLGQGTPWSAARRMKRRIAAAYGGSVSFGGRTLTTFPEFADLLRVDAAEFGALLRNERKGRYLAAALAAVVELRPEWLLAAPYEEAERALLRVPGIGRWTCDAILVCGLGRMERLGAADAAHLSGLARRIYGRGYHPDAPRARYGKHVGYWAYYLRNSVN